MSYQQEPRPSHPVILVGDHETANQIDHLRDAAAEHGASIVEVHAYEPAQASRTDDMTQVDAVVRALGSAVSQRVSLWVPFPMQDLGQEQHVRRLSLVLQRHGLNLMVGPTLAPCPTEGGLSAADFALRAEVRAVDALDRAALAAGAVATLSGEIEDELARHVPVRTEHSNRRRPRPTGRSPRRPPAADATDDTLARLKLEVLKRLERRFGPAPALPPPDTPWPRRQPRLKEYARWLVGPCNMKQSMAADLLNALGQRTKHGREWQRANLSALINGRYDGDIAA